MKEFLWESCVSCIVKNKELPMVPLSNRHNEELMEIWRSFVLEAKSEASQRGIGFGTVFSEAFTKNCAFGLLIVRL